MTTCAFMGLGVCTVHRIARNGIESSTRPGRHRWTIERTMARLAGCRRLHRRYERKAEHFLAFTAIACTLICYRRLTSTTLNRFVTRKFRELLVADQAAAMARVWLCQSSRTTCGILRPRVAHGRLMPHDR